MKIVIDKDSINKEVQRRNMCDVYDIDMARHYKKDRREPKKYSRAKEKQTKIDY